MGEQKFVQIVTNGQGHMTNMAARLIYGKNLKSLLLWILCNQMIDGLERWYAVSGT